MNKKGEWFEIVVQGKLNGKTIENVLKTFFNAPKKLMHQMRMDKGVTLNGQEKPWNTILSEGDRLQLHLFQEEEYGVDPEYIEIDVLYEDDHLLIVNKPANMDTHPSNPSQNHTLANAVAFHLQMNGIKTKIRHIHRLDQDTTGAVLFAKHALAGAIMDRLLENREIKRTYLAKVHGRIKKKKGSIQEPIGRDRHHSSRRRVSPTGQNAITHYEVIHYDNNTDSTLVKLQLETGRTHQIRVHMSHIKHPLLGDTLYGGDSKTAKRQALHAVKLALPHPITMENIECMAPFLDEPPIFDETYDMALQTSK